MEEIQRFSLSKLTFSALKTKTTRRDGRIRRKPTREMEANPIKVVLLSGEVSAWKKYLVPMFLRAKQRFDPTENVTPTRDAGASESGSEPIAEIKTVIMMKTTSESTVIFPM